MVRFLTRWMWIIWCWIELAIFTLFLYPLAWLPKTLTGRYYHGLSRKYCWSILRAFGIDLKLHQKNIHPLPKNFILISNHPSAAEDFAIPALFDVYPLAKEEVKDWYFVGRISKAAGTIYVKRENRDSRKTALETLTQAISEGYNIAIFPEGGCKGRRIYSSFQTGAFDVSIRTGVPLLPVFIHYEEQETFEWQDPDLLPHKIWHFMNAQNNRANYYVYDAIYPDKFSDKKEFAEHVHKQYLKWQERYLD